jgi:hypothetical protein
MHFTLLKSDIICSFYTNLNIEKYAVVLAGKPNTFCGCVFVDVLVVPMFSCGDFLPIFTIVLTYKEYTVYDLITRPFFLHFRTGWNQST